MLGSNTIILKWEFKAILTGRGCSFYGKVRLSLIRDWNICKVLSTIVCCTSSLHRQLCRLIIQSEVSLKITSTKGIMFEFRCFSWHDNALNLV